MPDTYNLTQNYAIDVILEEYLLVNSGRDPLLALLPMGYEDTSKVVWDQPENGYGLLSLRGLGGTPDVTGIAGSRQYSLEPGYYGEKVVFHEKQLTLSRELGTPNEPASLDWFVSNGMRQLSRRALDQARNIISKLFRLGRYDIRSRDGRVQHADSIENYNVLVPGTSWSNYAAATPIDDLLLWKNQLQTGTSSKFGKESTLIAQTATINDLLQCSQIRSAFKMKFGSSPLGLDGMNDILNGFELPKIEVYDEGYYDTEANAIARTGFIRHIPAKSLIWAGTRPEGVPIGKFVLTRNLVNKPPIGNMPDLRYDNNSGQVKGSLSEGLYTLLEYYQKPPVRLELDIGFNGGPAIRYPSAAAGIYYV